jgi:hypothetical protein
MLMLANHASRFIATVVCIFISENRIRGSICLVRRFLNIGEVLNVRIPALHEALITLEMFNEVQAKLKGKSKHQKDHEEFPFRGFILCGQCHKPLTAGMCGRRNQTYAHYWCHRKGCTTRVSKFDAEGLFCFGLEFIRPSMELLARLPEVTASMWATRKDQIANESKILTRRLAEQNELNRKTILARVNGILSDDDFKVLKSSIAEELTRITKAIETLDAEKSSYAALMQEAKEDVVNLRRHGRREVCTENVSCNGPCSLKVWNGG